MNIYLDFFQAIWRNHFDKEYCLKLVKSVPERIKAVIKA